MFLLRFTPTGNFLCLSFLFSLAPWRFLPTGNCSPGDFSTPLCSARNDKRAWLHSVSYRQETVREGFPIQLGSMVLLAHRKLLAKGFLFGLIPQCFLPTGNCSRRVSYSAWLHGVLYRQETVRERFPVRLDSTVFLTDRKLFALVSCPPWLHVFPYRQETFCLWFPVRLDSTVFLTDRKLFAYSFLFDVAPLRFISIGNYSHMVSYPV